MLPAVPRYENENESFEHSLAYHAMVTVDKVLYVIGGYTTVKYLNSAKKFEPLTKTWSEASSVITVESRLFRQLNIVESRLSRQLTTVESRLSRQLAIVESRLSRQLTTV